MKIAIIYLGRKGGGPIFAIEIAKRLAKKATVQVFISKHIENFSEWCGENIKAYNVKPPFLSIMEPLKLVKDIVDFSPEVVLFVMLHPLNHFIIGSIRKRLKKVKVFGIVHDPKPHPGDPFYMGFLNKMDILSYDKIITLSRYSKYALKSFTNKKIYYFPHPAMTSYQDYNQVENDFPESLKNLKKFINNQQSKIVFTFLGRISKYKGIDYLAKALELLKDEEVFEKMCMVIAGRGKIRRETLKLISNNSHVYLINKWLDNKEISAIARITDVFVLPYTEASQSGVIAIAFAFKKPVICSAVGGLPEQVQYGKFGILIEPKSAESIASTMAYSVRNYEMLESKKEALKSYNPPGWEEFVEFLYGIMNKEILS